jgi:hypothetical protein
MNFLNVPIKTAIPSSPIADVGCSLIETED